MRADHSAKALLCAVGLAIPLLLAGCSGDSIVPSDMIPSAPSSSAAATGDAPGTDADTGADTDTITDTDNAPAATQADNCGWESPKLSAGVPSPLPTTSGNDVQSAIVGSWQHTHYDSGAGFQALDGEDIRFVFSSADTLRYCQHVPGSTNYAERGASVTWEGNRMVLPGSAPGYVVESWDADTMVWINRMDDSRYVLQRR